MKTNLQVTGLFCTVILLTATITTNASENDRKQIENQNNHKVLLSSNNSHSITGDVNTVISGGQLHNEGDGKNSTIDNDFDRSFPASWDEAY
ncbi:MAG: hypothetical protein GXP13_03555 [Gammaproteobacteria bacterium]|nr:hypothetical protein [Gammaproteobacteria bacterium]